MLLTVRNVENKVSFHFKENLNFFFIQHEGLLGAVVRDGKEVSAAESNRGRNTVRNPQCHGN